MRGAATRFAGCDAREFARNRLRYHSWPGPTEMLVTALPRCLGGRHRYWAGEGQDERAADAQICSLRVRRRRDRQRVRYPGSERATPGSSTRGVAA